MRFDFGICRVVCLERDDVFILSVRVVLRVIIMFSSHHPQSYSEQFVSISAPCPIVENVRSAGLLSRAQVEFNSAVRAAVGRRNVTLYGAAGAGFSDFHTTINSPQAFFVSHYDQIDLVTCLFKAQEFMRTDKLAEASYRPSVDRYKFDKLGSGFASYGCLEGEYSLSVAIATELSACGVSEFEIVSTRLGPAIEYAILGIDYHVCFIQGDVLSVSIDELASQAGMAIDTYYHRAAMEIPSTYQGEGMYFMRDVFAQMPTGGVFVTDDISASPTFRWLADCSDSFPMSFENTDGILCEEALPRDLLRQMYRSGVTSLPTAYGSLLRIRRKYYSE